MKKLINVSMVVLALAFGAAALSAQAAGGAQKPAAPAKTTAKKSDKKATDKKMENPCPAGEHLKDAKKKMDAKTNPCVKDKK